MNVNKLKLVLAKHGLDVMTICKQLYRGIKLYNGSTFSLVLLDSGTIYPVDEAEVHLYRRDSKLILSAQVCSAVKQIGFFDLRFYECKVKCIRNSVGANTETEFYFVDKMDVDKITDDMVIENHGRFRTIKQDGKVIDTVISPRDATIIDAIIPNTMQNIKELLYSETYYVGKVKQHAVFMSDILIQFPDVRNATTKEEDEENYTRRLRESDTHWDWQ